MSKRPLWFVLLGFLTLCALCVASFGAIVTVLALCVTYWKISLPAFLGLIFLSSLVKTHHH